MNSELKTALAVFENKLIDAWVYDTQLSFEDYPSSKKLDRAREKFTIADTARAELIAKIEELSNVSV